MRTRAGVTAAVAVLSLLASAAGHALLSGHRVDPSALPQLGLLASICFLLGRQRLRPPALVTALALVQAAVHVVLATAHQAGEVPAGAPVLAASPSMPAHHHMPGMAMPAPAVPAAAPDRAVDVPMLAMHLAAMLGTLWLLAAAGRWWERLVDALAQVLPTLPRLVPVVAGSRGISSYAVLPVPHPSRWLPAGVRRRGPPER